NADPEAALQSRSLDRRHVEPRHSLSDGAVRRDGAGKRLDWPGSQDRALRKDRDLRHCCRSRATSIARGMISIDLSGSNALVTVRTRGIGRSIAETLAAAGARVAVVGRDRARAEEAAAAVSPESRGFACDVGDVASVTTLVDDVEKAFGSIDILVNNAG